MHRIRDCLPRPRKSHDQSIQLPNAAARPKNRNSQLIYLVQTHIPSTVRSTEQSTQRTPRSNGHLDSPDSERRCRIQNLLHQFQHAVRTQKAERVWSFQLKKSDTTATFRNSTKIICHTYKVNQLKLYQSANNECDFEGLIGDRVKALRKPSLNCLAFVEADILAALTAAINQACVKFPGLKAEFVQVADSLVQKIAFLACPTTAKKTSVNTI